MHLGPAFKTPLLSVLLIGFLSINIDLWAQENPKTSPVPLVEVEPTNIVPADVTGGFTLVPYRLRRENWGTTFGLSYSLFTPEFYEPDAITAEFDEIYGAAETALVELTFAVKKNFAIGSIGGELGVGMYRNQSNSEIVIDGTPVDFESDLSLTLIRLGAVFTMDNLYMEPYFAPYIGAGVYTIQFREAQSAASFNGNTQMAPFFWGGVLLQLDWVDKDAARESYQEAGIQNTFLFLEARKFMSSSAAKDPDFETALHANAGLKVEF